MLKINIQKCIQQTKIRSEFLPEFLLLEVSLNSLKNNSILPRHKILLTIPG